MANTLKVISPFDGASVGEASLSESLDVEGALEQAYRLFLDQDSWLKPAQRIEVLKKTAHIMTTERETLALRIAKEGGKPLIDAKVEVDRAIQGVESAVGVIQHLHGREVPMALTPSTSSRLAFTIKEPIGVVVAISAFNHPLNLIVHQVIPAIIAGCPIVVKPSSATPLSCLRFVEILREAGLPDGWCQAVVCSAELAEQMATDPRVNFLSFIGSASIGWSLKSKLSPGTRCALEHGGVAPVVVDRDADLDLVVPALLKGAFYHAGQVCVSVQKIFAHHEIFKALSSRLAEGARKLRVGDPTLETTEVGPLINQNEVDRIEAWVQEAQESGGEILAGGERISRNLYSPTVIANPSRGTKVSREEIFGPVVAVYSFKEAREVVAEINSMPLAFQAAVFTREIDQAFYFVKRINASSVMINDHTAFRADWMPFGGRDSSGIGVAGIPYSAHEMTREKLIVFKSPSI
jgi:acyl-CoA reductase-like NAD-dependent aldehyde dehydrogenase